MISDFPLTEENACIFKMKKATLSKVSLQGAALRLSRAGEYTAVSVPINAQSSSLMGTMHTI